MSTISAGTTLTTALVQTGDTTGNLVIKTDNGNTTAATFSTGGNLNIPTAGARITGDFSNATVANRLAFQTSTANSTTSVFILPSGTGTTGQLAAFNNSDPTNSSNINLTVNTTESSVRAGSIGSGTALPLTLHTNGSERMRVDTSGNVGIGTSSPSYKLDVAGSGSIGVRYKSSVNYSGFIADNTSSTGGGFYSAYQNGSQKALFGVSGAFEGNTSSDAMIASDATGGAIRFYTNGVASEKMRLDSSGNLGIGTSSPSGKFDVYTGGNTDAYVRGGGAVRLFLSASSYDWKIASNYYLTGGLQFTQGGTTQGRFDESGNFGFNSGYGSAATAYGCRAWVNFNGTGTVAIRASGNVSSITDNGTGNYTVNFTTAMPDANYAVVATPSKQGLTGYYTKTINVIDTVPPTTTSCRICNDYPTNTNNEDTAYALVAFFR